MADTGLTFVATLCTAASEAGALMVICKGLVVVEDVIPPLELKEYQMLAEDSYQTTLDT